MSLSHILILILLITVFTKPSRVTGLFRGLGEGARNFKKGLNGESDIDITDSVKKLDE